MQKLQTGPTTIQKIYRKLVIAWERVNGIDFSTVIPVADLGLDHSLVLKGSPSGNKYLTQLFDKLNIGPNEKILDLGCAKGDAIRCMLKFPFSNVDGIEISDILSKIAVNNFRKLNEKRVNITNVDAAHFLNYKNYDFFYLYNPFPDSIMEKVLAQLKAQISPTKEVIIIYNNPVCHDLMLGNGLYKINEFPDMWGNGIYLYSNFPISEKLKHLQIQACD